MKGLIPCGDRKRTGEEDYKYKGETGSPNAFYPLTYPSAKYYVADMNRICLPLFSAAAAFAPFCAPAATEYYFMPSSTGDMNWNLPANWQTSDDGGLTFSPAENLPGASDAVVFDQSKCEDIWPDGTGMGLYITGETRAGSIMITGNVAGMSFASYNLTAETASASSLVVEGDYSVILNGAGGWSGKYLASGTYNPLSVEVKGDMIFDRLNNTGTLTYTLGGSGSDNALKSLKIAGDFKNNTGQIGFGTFACERDAAKIAEDRHYYYKNADVQIGGSITGTSTIFLSSAGIGNTIISVNGLNTSNGEIRATNDNKGTVGATSTLVFSNAGSAVFKGGITDLYSYKEGMIGIEKANVVVDIVMMGAQNSQQKLILSTDKKAFRGGATIISGDLRMYTAYKNNTAEGQWGKWGDIRLEGNSDGIGAKFGAIGSNGSETDANAVAYADNLVWTSGTIVSGIISEAQASLIELSGTMQKGEGADGEFWFEFTGNTEYLLEDGASIKLISWTDGNAPTDFLESEFKAADMNGKTAKFAIESDGLYVSYVVPEPATIAAILGALALGFALRRRR